MKTLSDLKKDLSLGREITLTMSRGLTAETGTRKEKFTPRYVVKKQTNGVYFNKDKNATGGSWLDYPKASLLDYDGMTVKIYEAGYRPLTDEEKRVSEDRPSRRKENAKQVEIDMLGDGSQMYWADKRHFMTYSMLYMMSGKTEGGLYYDSNKNLVRDDKIKGELVLIYQLI